MAKKNSFETGTVVILKSGGPLMTVHKTTKHGVECAWFATYQSPDVCKDIFHGQMLKEVRADNQKRA